MSFISRTLACILSVMALVLSPARYAAAQAIEATVFTGLAYPLYDERLTVRPGGPTIPGVEVTVGQPPVLSGDGGSVFGGALALQFGLLGLEARVDSMGVGIDFSGARYDLRGIAFPFQGVNASVTASPGRFDADRIQVLSLNARVRTPGPIGLIASGGISYLPDMSVSGSVPLSVLAPELPPLGFDAGLTLRASPGDAGHRLGVNGGAGVRIGGRVALVAEARAFYFRDYDLQFGTANGPAFLDELLSGADVVEFEPVFINAQVGLSFRF